MPSTFTTNLGIQKPANGEQAGAWGQTVNANSDILDRAVNGSLSLSLTGTSSTLTTLQGAVSNGQYKVLTLTGSPSGTHTITIDPSTAQTLYLVNNTTAQSVIFTQGSGGNVTIVAGASAIIYSDGAGAGAKVTDLTNALAMSAVKITGGTITGATISGIPDLAVADGGTGASTASGALINLGLTATAAEINVLDGMTSSTAELNILDGATLSTTELNYVAGVTSAIQTQLDAKAPSASPTLSAPTLSGTITVTGGTQNWTAIASGTNLTFAYNGVNKMRLDSSGNITVTGNVTAFGTIA